MKNQIINSVLAVLFSAVTVFASSSEPTITTDGSKSFIIDSKTWKSTEVEVRIKDDSGAVIFSDNQKMTKSKRYSLKNLEAGNYTVTISNEYKIVENKITITKDGLILDFAADTTFKPLFTTTDNFIDINYLAGGLDTKTYIQNNEETLYTSPVDKSMSINKRYDISDLQPGTYSVTVSNKNGTFSKTFTK